MIERNSFAGIIVVALGLTACAAGPASRATERASRFSSTFSHQLHRPTVIPGRLAYAPDRTPFAPILTERTGYPTQAQANDAYRHIMAAQLSTADSVPTSLNSRDIGEKAFEAYPVSVRLFGCKPGAVDNMTARIVSERGAIHCAVDFLNGDGRPAYRAPVNFRYLAGFWRMEIADPPRTRVSWRDRQRSPTDEWRWIPGRARYE